MQPGVEVVGWFQEHPEIPSGGSTLSHVRRPSKAIYTIINDCCGRMLSS